MQRGMLHGSYSMFHNVQGCLWYAFDLLALNCSRKLMLQANLLAWAFSARTKPFGFFNMQQFCLRTRVKAIISAKAWNGRSASAA